VLNVSVLFATKGVALSCEFNHCRAIFSDQTGNLGLGAPKYGGSPPSSDLVSRFELLSRESAVLKKGVRVIILALCDPCCANQKLLQVFLRLRDKLLLLHRNGHLILLCVCIKERGADPDKDH
jgi:hypothetical protein